MSRILDANVQLALAHGILLTPVKARSKDIEDATVTIETFDQWRAAQATYGADINAAVHLNPSNLCVIDLDRPDGYALLSSVMRIPSTMMVQSRRGFHLYYRRPNDFTVGNSGELYVGEEHLGQYLCGNFDFHYALLPGSVHPSGAIYRWLHLPSDGIALMPGEIHRHKHADSIAYDEA